MPAASDSSRLAAPRLLPTLGVARLLLGLLLLLALLCSGGALELPLDAAKAMAAEAAALISPSKEAASSSSSSADPTSVRRRSLDEEVSNDGTYPPAAVAATTTTTTTTATTTTTTYAVAASTPSAQLYQPALLVVEGQPAHHGLASISNPCTFSNLTKGVDKDDIFLRVTHDVEIGVLWLTPVFFPLVLIGWLVGFLCVVRSKFCRTVGTPWCDGLPTFWITGHQTCFESPRCLVNGTWTRNNRTVLDVSDALNGGPIDRHYCVTMDVNKDNRTDIICGVGAVLGTGDGYTELYLTQPDGSVQKMLVCDVTLVM
jgi:hypothetical protein